MSDITNNAAPAAPTPDQAQGNSPDPTGVGGDAGSEQDEGAFAVDMFEQMGDYVPGSDGEPEDGNVAPPSAPDAAKPDAAVAANNSPGAAAPDAPQGVAPAVAPPVAPVAAPAATPPVVAPADASGAAAPQQAAQPNETAATSPLEVFRAEVEKNKDVFTKALASQVYALSDTDRDRLATEPEVVVPELLAKAHVSIVQNVVGTIAQQMPAVIGGYLAAQQQHKDLEDKFFSAWPQLDRTADRATVTAVAAAYRKSNPRASFEEMSRFVGAQAVVMLNKLPAAPPAQRPAAAQVPRQASFVPAANGSGAAPPIAPAGDNLWGNAAQMLNEDFD